MLADRLARQVLRCSKCLGFLAITCSSWLAAQLLPSQRATTDIQQHHSMTSPGPLACSSGSAGGVPLLRSTTFLTCSLLSCGHIAKLMQSRLACCTVVVSACGSSASATACIPFGLEMASHARTLIACLLQHACNTNRNSLFLPDCCLQHALVYESIPQMSPNIISQDVDRKANAAKESLLAGHAGKHDSRRREMFGAPSQDSSPNWPQRQ